MPRRRSSPEVGIAFGALFVLVVAIAFAERRQRRQSVDLETTNKQLRQLQKHTHEQAVRIEGLEEEKPTEMFEAMQREMGEMLLELDGPAGANVDLRRGVPGMANPALLEPPVPGDEIVLPAELGADEDPGGGDGLREPE